MTESQVVALLGKPTETSGGSIGGLSGGTSVWKSDSATVSITFVNGKVFAKQFTQEVK